MRTGLWPGGNSQGWEIVSRGSNPCPAPASNVGCVVEASFKEQGGRGPAVWGGGDEGFRGCSIGQRRRAAGGEPKGEE
jgi:hypothetical protein